MNKRADFSDMSVLSTPSTASADQPRRLGSLTPSKPGERSARKDVSDSASLSFKLPASRGIGRTSGMEGLSRVLDIFAPSSPVLNPAYFIGRAQQIEQLIDAIEEHRNHVLLFGPRGCGKTSLALTLLSAAKKADYTAAYLSCSRSSTFESLLRPVLAKLPVRYDAAAAASDSIAGATFEDLLRGEVTPQLVGALLARVTGTRILIVLDEFDLQNDTVLTTQLVELMKSLSDHAAPAHVVLVGVGGASDDLLGRQSSIPRSLFKMKLGHMSDEQIEAVVLRLMTLSGLQITPEALKEIVAASGGKLFVAKLMALRAAKQAIEANARLIDTSDFSGAVDDLCQHFNSEGLTALHEVIAKNPSLQIILQALLRTVREVGDEFTVEQVYARYAHQGEANKIPPNRVELILQSLTGMGNVLVEVPKDTGKMFRFVDPNVELAIAIGGYRARSASRSDTGRQMMTRP